MRYHIFVEGIPGSGKSTLLAALEEKLPDYRIYREGDISPVELAWCAYMTEQEYENVLKEEPGLSAEIEAHTVQENHHYITAYTRIVTEDYNFYKKMEAYELYGGRRSMDEFCRIVLERFRAFKQDAAVFECSLFQNIIEELMLFAGYSDAQILAFYEELLHVIDDNKFRLIRLVNASDELEDSIQRIKEERVNDAGDEVWYEMMLAYLSGSPYGQLHGVNCFQDIITHFKRRLRLEEQVMNLLPAGSCLDVRSRHYELHDILDWIKGQ